MAAHLEDVSTDDLIKEVQRRLECATKPEKHVVLIGKLRAALLLHRSFDVISVPTRGRLAML